MRLWVSAWILVVLRSSTCLCSMTAWLLSHRVEMNICTLRRFSGNKYVVRYRDHSIRTSLNNTMAEEHRHIVPRPDTPRPRASTHEESASAPQDILPCNHVRKNAYRLLTEYASLPGEGSGSELLFEHYCSIVSPASHHSTCLPCSTSSDQKNPRLRPQLNRSAATLGRPIHLPPPGL